VEACDSCLSELLLSSIKVSPTVRHPAVPIQPPLDLELSSPDRMHIRTMFPAAMQSSIINPITPVVVDGVLGRQDARQPRHRSQRDS
jgi:hypothetical protein